MSKLEPIKQVYSQDIIFSINCNGMALIRIEKQPEKLQPIRDKAWVMQSLEFAPSQTQKKRDEFMRIYTLEEFRIRRITVYVRNHDNYTKKWN